MTRFWVPPGAWTSPSGLSCAVCWWRASRKILAGRGQINFGLSFWCPPLFGTSRKMEFAFVSKGRERQTASASKLKETVLMLHEWVAY